MKKLVFASIAIALLTCGACRNHRRASVPGAVKTRPVSVTIAVSKDSSGDISIKANPDPVEIHRSKHEVLRFCVDFPTAEPETVVTIDNFVGVGNTANRRNPFGNGDAQNVFDIANYHFKCFVQTQEPKPAAVAGVSEHYKYNVTVKVGGRVVKTLDPHVIISD